MAFYIQTKRKGTIVAYIRKKITDKEKPKGKRGRPVRPPAKNGKTRKA